MNRAIIIIIDSLDIDISIVSIDIRGIPIVEGVAPCPSPLEAYPGTMVPYYRTYCTLSSTISTLNLLVYR